MPLPTLAGRAPPPAGPAAGPSRHGRMPAGRRPGRRPGAAGRRGHPVHVRHRRPARRSCRRPASRPPRRSTRPGSARRAAARRPGARPAAPPAVRGASPGSYDGASVPVFGQLAGLDGAALDERAPRQAALAVDARPGAARRRARRRRRAGRGHRGAGPHAPGVARLALTLSRLRGRRPSRDGGRGYVGRRCGQPTGRSRGRW